jgi:hypothetical protein
MQGNQGAGVVGLKEFKAGELIAEYKGKLISYEDARVTAATGSKSANCVVMRVSNNIYVDPLRSKSRCRASYINNSCDPKEAYAHSLNPNLKFLQENVGSASKLDVGIMSILLGVYPARLNSENVVAQKRDRYYWSNIKMRNDLFDMVTDIPYPTDRKILLKDIITSGEVKEDKHKALMHRMYYSFGHKDKLSGKAQKYIRDREKFGNTIIYEDGYLRMANKTELCRLQGFPDDYCEILNLQQTASLLGDSWTLPMIEHILSFYAVP